MIVFDILISPESIDSSFKRFNTRGFHYVARQAISCVNDSLCEEVLSEACVYSSLKHLEFMASDCSSVGSNHGHVGSCFRVVNLFYNFKCLNHVPSEAAVGECRQFQWSESFWVAHVS